MHLTYSTRTLALRTFIVAVLNVSLASPLDPSPAVSLEPPSSSSFNLSSLLTDNNSYLVKTNWTFYDVFPAAINANVQCDGARYGQFISRVACEDALHKIGTTLEYFTVAQRGIGRRPAMALPQRYSSTNGKCVIDLVTAPGVFSDSVSLNDIKQAAARVVTGCATQPGPLTGGSLGGVGLGNNLIVIVRQYEPTITCSASYGAPPPAGSCFRPLGLVPVGTQRKLFGYKARPGVQEPLPRTFRAGQYLCTLDFRTEGAFLVNQKRLLARSTCSVHVDKLGLEDYGQWFDLWQGAVAVAAMCVDQGSAGMAYRLGEQGLIRVTLAKIGSGAVAVAES